LNTTAKTCTPCNTADSVVIGIYYCVNCTLISSTNGPNTGNTACQCNYPLQWYWNTTSLTGSCICNVTYEVTTSNGSCVSCQNVTYATGAVVTNSNACTCLTNFAWSATDSTCYCPSNFTLLDNGTCVCNTTTSARIGTFCIYCSQIPYSSGPSATNTACVCITTSYLQWYWNATSLTGSCICNATY
jgi:hypothetical protein